MTTPAGLLQTTASHKLATVPALTTAPPTLAGHGVAIPDTWKVGTKIVRRALLRITAAAAANVTAISVWCYVDDVWTRHSAVADQTFVAGDLVHGILVEWPLGTRLAVAYTSAAVNVTIEWYPLETCE